MAELRSLIQRVERLLPFRAVLANGYSMLTLHDHRDKIVLAGIDIARGVAEDHRLPPVTRSEDVLDGYSSSNVLDLAYRMGLLHAARMATPHQSV